MMDMGNMSNKMLVREQYKNTSNLALRKSLHDKYSVNKVGLHKWMFEQYPFRPKMKVLELGSGKGDLWEYYFENDILQEYEMDITLSDFSDGMVDYMKERYSGKRISVEKIDITAIPFEDDTFDMIIANAMLYHVKDIDLALFEVARVLKKDGQFFCSTSGNNGMMQFLYSALDELGISYNHESDMSFTLQNGMQLLKKHFHKVKRRDYEDALEIDAVEDYLAYIYSMASMQGLEWKHYDSLLNYFRSKKVNGYLHVPKEYGMFAAGKEDYITWIRSKVGHEKIMLVFAGGCVFNESGEVLLQRRGDGNKWGFPGGAIELGETPEQAAKREVKEETGLDVEIEELLDIYTEIDLEYPNGDKAQSICIVYKLKVVGGELTCDNIETLELKWFSLNNLPPLFCKQHEDMARDLLL